MNGILAAVHTGAVTIDIIKKLCSELIPGIRVVNVLDDGLISDIGKCETLSPEIIRRISSYMISCEAMGADMILNCCSSIGEANEIASRLVRVPVIRIDDAMATLAVDIGKRIGVVATVRTTLGPTSRLLEEKAKLKEKKIEVISLLCDGAYEAIMNGDRNRHDEIVKRNLFSLLERVEVIVFAQASMSKLASEINLPGSIPLLSSPRICIDSIARSFKNCGA